MLPLTLATVALNALVLGLGVARAQTRQDAGSSGADGDEFVLDHTTKV